MSKGLLFYKSLITWQGNCMLTGMTGSGGVSLQRSSSTMCI